MAALAQRAGHDVRVVAATLVRSLGVGHRGLKNDVRDARVLSEASCRMDLPSVHIPTAISQEVKAICVSREALIKTRTQLIGRVRGYVRARLGRVLRATPESLPKRVRKALARGSRGAPGPLGASARGAGDGERADCGGRYRAAHARRGGRADVAFDDGAWRRARHGGAVRGRDRRHRAIPDGRERRVVSRSGAGENTTGFRTKRTRLTRAGAPQVRWALGQAAWSLYIRRKTDPMALWAKQIAERRGAQVAIMALARKLAHVLYAIWKHEVAVRPDARGATRRGVDQSVVEPRGLTAIQRR